ncbi:hypothetical protein LX36DRAFT_498448 [Colletotrichum falcatum]|nr:hypothetical protein LX36DRAFT_498448 [Colletotrichum falcatum]
MQGHLLEPDQGPHIRLPATTSSPGLFFIFIFLPFLFSFFLLLLLLLTATTRHCATSSRESSYWLRCLSLRFHSVTDPRRPISRLTAGVLREENPPSVTRAVDIRHLRIFTVRGHCLDKACLHTVVRPRTLLSIFYPPDQPVASIVILDSRGFPGGESGSTWCNESVSSRPLFSSSATPHRLRGSITDPNRHDFFPTSHPVHTLSLIGLR